MVHCFKKERKLVQKKKKKKKNSTQRENVIVNVSLPCVLCFLHNPSFFETMRYVYRKQGSQKKTVMHETWKLDECAVKILH